MMLHQKKADEVACQQNIKIGSHVLIICVPQIQTWLVLYCKIKMHRIIFEQHSEGAKIAWNIIKFQNYDMVLHHENIGCCAPPKYENQW